MAWQIIIILVFVFWLYLKVSQAIKHSKIIGKQVVVEYFDHNISFEKIFPLTGTVTGKIKIGSQKLFIVLFKKPFRYQNSDFNKIVNKERHPGYYIGGKGDIHVHVCLPKKELSQNKYQWADFDHVVWAIIKNVSTPQ